MKFPKFKKGDVIFNKSSKDCSPFVFLKFDKRTGLIFVTEHVAFFNQAEAPKLSVSLNDYRIFIIKVLEDDEWGKFPEKLLAEVAKSLGTKSPQPKEEEPKDPEFKTKIAPKPPQQPSNEQIPQPTSQPPKPPLPTLSRPLPQPPTGNEQPGGGREAGWV